MQKSSYLIYLFDLPKNELELYIAEESCCNVNKSAILVYHKANCNNAIFNHDLSANLMQKSLGHATETIKDISLTWRANILVFPHHGRQKHEALVKLYAFERTSFCCCDIVLLSTMDMVLLWQHFCHKWKYRSMFICLIIWRSIFTIQWAHIR